jgi:hypothetical protein
MGPAELFAGEVRLSEPRMLLCGGHLLIEVTATDKTTAVPRIERRDIGHSRICIE